MICVISGQAEDGVKIFPYYFSRLPQEMASCGANVDVDYIEIYRGLDSSHSEWEVSKK